jgi:hypothetical protein
MTSWLKQCFKLEFRISNVVFQWIGMSLVMYVVIDVTFTGYIRWVERVWQCGGQKLEPNKSVRKFVTAADNRQRAKNARQENKCDKCSSGQQAPRVKPLPRTNISYNAFNYALNPSITTIHFYCVEYSELSTTYFAQPGHPLAINIKHKIFWRKLATKVT